MRKTLILFLSLATALFSCKKDEELQCPPSNDVPTANEFAQLKVGNYWVYQPISIDLETGVETEIGPLDTVKVDRDTLIDGQQYFVLKGQWFNVEFESVRRVDGQNIVTADGDIIFSSNTSINELDVIYEPNPLIDSVEVFVGHNEHELELPVGDLISEHQYIRRHFVDPDSGSIIAEGDEVQFYVEGVGIARYTSFYLMAGLPIQMQLVSYHLE